MQIIQGKFLVTCVAFFYLCHVPSLSVQVSREKLLQVGIGQVPHTPFPSRMRAAQRKGLTGKDGFTGRSSQR